MYFSQYVVNGTTLSGSESIMKMIYRALKGTRETHESHNGNRPSPFAVKLEDSKHYISVWGNLEELLVLRARRYNLQPRITVSVNSLYKLAPKESVVTVRHISPTAFRSYGSTIPGFVKDLYFIRPARVLAEAGVKPEPRWERIFVNTRPRLWKVRGGVVHGFLGEVTFYGVNDDLKLLLAASEFTGLGYKTGWGMGGIKVVSAKGVA